MAFLPLRNSTHVAVSDFIDFPLTSCYLKLSDKLQKQICRTVGPSLSSLLSFFAHLGMEFSCYRMLSFDLSGVKPRINRHLLTLGSF